MNLKRCRSVRFRFFHFPVPCPWFYCGKARLSLLWGSGCKIRLPNLGAYGVCAVPCPPPSHHLLIRLFPPVRTWRCLFYNFLTRLSRPLTLFFLFSCFPLAPAGKLAQRKPIPCPSVRDVSVPLPLLPLGQN